MQLTSVNVFSIFSFRIDEGVYTWEASMLRRCFPEGSNSLISFLSFNILNHIEALLEWPKLKTEVTED